MKPYEHQVKIAGEGFKVLKQHGLVYLAMEERTGKTLTSILLVEQTIRKNCLVLTKKKALGGWVETISKYTNSKVSETNGVYRGLLRDSKTITVTNYHQAANVHGKYDIVILDEAHSYLSAYPKRGKIWKSVKPITKGLPIIYLSATPNAQGYQLLVNQFALSNWGPWKAYINFYKWFNDYGISNKTRTPYGLIEQYNKCIPETWNSVKHLFITYTRQELDFEHEPEDILHYVTLSEKSKKYYNDSINKEVLKYNDLVVPLDTPMKLRTTLHMIEGGVFKYEDKSYILDTTDKIDAIKADFGDSEDLVIMYNYIAEGIKLRKAFTNATILQGTSYAEGVDLSGYANLVIYSQDFSTARHSQRRARQANKARDTAIKVHFYLVKGAVSEQVYTTVSKNKTNFIDSLFTRSTL